MGASCEGEGESKNTSLSPGMIRQFSLLEMSKNTAAENMTAMLENAEFHLSNINSDVNRCGLSYLLTKAQEHNEDESKRFNNLSVRLIGAQAIALARYCYRLVDALQTPSESEGENLRRLALGKILEGCSIKFM